MSQKEKILVLEALLASLQDAMIQSNLPSLPDDRFKSTLADILHFHADAIQAKPKSIGFVYTK